MRYHVQRITTGEWLTRDLPMMVGSVVRELSGPGGIDGVVSPEVGPILGPDGRPLLDRWSTAIYAEDDNGEIASAGIVTDIEYNPDDQSATITCPGFTTYPHGVPYLDRHQFGRVDPMEVLRFLWDYLQSFPNGDLGMVVDDAVSDTIVGTVQEPYYIAWWETTDIGSEIDALASETPFDYREGHHWADDTKTEVTHRLRLGLPRLGKRREDLRFSEGENIVAAVPVLYSGSDGYANEIQGVGKGEGRTAIQANAALDDGRLRRPMIVTDKLAEKQRLDRIVNNQLRKRSDVGDIDTVTVSDDPKMARLSDIGPGDDIHIQCHVPWLGEFDSWVRVLSITQTDDSDVATLAVARSSSFVYSTSLEIGTVG